MATEGSALSIGNEVTFKVIIYAKKFESNEGTYDLPFDIPGRIFMYEHLLRLGLFSAWSRSNSRSGTTAGAATTPQNKSSVIVLVPS